jgi:hypothetical protein
MRFLVAALLPGGTGGFACLSAYPGLLGRFGGTLLLLALTARPCSVFVCSEGLGEETGIGVKTLRSRAERAGRFYRPNRRGGDPVSPTRNLELRVHSIKSMSHNGLSRFFRTVRRAYAPIRKDLRKPVTPLRQV